MIKKIFALPTLVFFAFCLKAQTLPNVIGPSPSAMQYQKYGDYPVSHFTGIPGITIPIYTIKEGDLEVPITLTYHNSGYKPDDDDCVVGLGWTLNIGGQISRTQVDEEDQRIFPWSPNKIYPTEAHLNNIIAYPAYNWDAYHYMKYLEGKPGHDIFSFDFFGNHGKFVLKDFDPAQCMLLDYKPLLITGTENGGPLASFNIKDETGRSFAFNEKEYPSGFSDSWKLTSIKSATDVTNEIIYTYTVGSTIHPNLKLDTYIRDDDESVAFVYRSCSDFNGPVPRHIWEFMDFQIASTFVDYSNTTYQAKLPSLITFKNGSVKFTYDAVTKALSYIEIYNKRNELLKKVQVILEKQPAMSQHRSLIFLKKVKFFDRTNTFINEYALNYINENTPPPNYPSVDYWGYYNGLLGMYGENSNLIPRFFMEFRDHMGNASSQTIGTNYRRSSEYMMKMYTLNEIILPTGGRTVFEFEANRYSGQDGPIPDYFQQEVGGLRVKRILNYTATDRLATVKEYDYLQSRVDIIPTREYFARSERMHMLNSQNHVFENFRRTYVTGYPTVNIAPHGSPVVYPLVREYVKEIVNNTTAGTNTLGSTLYEYDYQPFDGYKFPTSNGLEGTGTYPLYAPYHGLIKPMNDGKLIRVSYEGSSTQVYTLYEYEEISVAELNSFYLRRYASYVGDPCPSGTNTDIYENPDYYYYWSLGSSQSHLNYGDVTIKSTIKRLKSVYETKDNIWTETVFNYANNTHNQPTSKTFINSKGETFKTTFKYPYEMQSSGTPNVYNAMVNRHIWSSVIEQAEYKGSTNIFLQSTKTNYDHWETNTWGTGTTGSLIMPRTVETKKSTSNAEIRMRYHAYDNIGNIVSVSKEHDTKKVYKWGYNQSYPIAEIVNGEVKDVFYTSFEEATGTNIASEGKTGRKSKTGGFTQTVTNLTNGNYVLSYWQKSGVNWVLSSTNVTVTLNSYPISLSGQLDEVRFHPATTLLTTFTYDPLIGLTSKTDPNNRTEYYEYDAALRLLHVRDEKRNVLKKYSYSYHDNAVASQTAPNWQNTGNSYCEPCTLNLSFYTGYMMVEQVDNNANSYTSGQKKWIRQGTTSCGSGEEYWQNTSNYRCVTNGGINTGIQERQQIFTNPCYENTYNLTRWVSVGNNPSACPAPSVFYSQDLSGHYTKGNCPYPDYAGGEVYVSVPAGMFSSPTSLAIANAQATQYAQGVANSDPSGTCTPIPFTLRCYNQTNEDFDIALINSSNSSIQYNFVSQSNNPGPQELGSILPGTYDITFLIQIYQNDCLFTVGCGYSTYGLYVTMHDIEITSDCNLIDIIY